MAQVAALPLTLPFTAGLEVYPVVRCYISTDAASVSTPTWIDKTAKVRSYATSRGRDSELSEFDAGTAQVVLDNRDRSLDPVINTLIRPMNRVWLFEDYLGEVHDIFKGYADSWTQDWDRSGIKDATATVQATDELKVASLVRMPATDPPRNTYEEVVMFDTPSGYWQFKSSTAFPAQATVGPSVDLQPNGSSWGSVTQGAIVGESVATAGYVNIGDLGGGAMYYQPTSYAPSDPGDPGGNDKFSVEFWIQSGAALPGSTNTIMVGPALTANRKWSISVTTAGEVLCVFRNGAGATTTPSGGAILPTNGWHHVVFVADGTNAILYFDGASVNSAAFSGVFGTGVDTGTFNAFLFGFSTWLAALDEIAFYDYALSAARVAAHYTAGSQRGVPRLQATGAARIGAILDAVGSTAPRSLQTGSRTAEGEFYASQAPLDMIRHAVEAENVDAGFFAAATGTLTYLADGYRSVSPYNTVQMTFDDDGTDSAYMDCSLDFSDSFLHNEINVTGAGGSLSTTSDTTSLGLYLKRSLSISSDFIVAANASTIAASLLTKYKAPFTRVTTIVPQMADPATALAVTRRELMDRIEIFRRPIGGGAAIDQISFIQKIEWSGTPGVPPSVKFGVSPL